MMNQILIVNVDDFWLRMQKKFINMREGKYRLESSKHNLSMTPNDRHDILTRHSVKVTGDTSIIYTVYPRGLQEGLSQSQQTLSEKWIHKIYLS